MFVQSQVTDHLRMQQADGVAGGGVAEAGMEFLGDGRAAEDVAAFEQRDGQAFARQVGGTGQAVVAGADDGDVQFRGHVLQRRTCPGSRWNRCSMRCAIGASTMVEEARKTTPQYRAYTEAKSLLRSEERRVGKECRRLCRSR